MKLKWIGQIEFKLSENQFSETKLLHTAGCARIELVLCKEGKIRVIVAGFLDKSNLFVHKRCKCPDTLYLQ